MTTTTKTNRLASGIYTIIFGLFGMNDFYLGHYRRGIVRLFAFVVPTIFFLFVMTPLRLSLVHMELLDNVYVPTISAEALAYFVGTCFAMGALLSYSVLRTLFSIVFYICLYKPQELTVTRRRYIWSALLLGWSGLHDFLINRTKYALFHVLMFILALGLIIISRVDFGINSAEFDAYMSVALAAGIAVAVINQIIAILEAANYARATKKV